MMQSREPRKTLTELKQNMRLPRLVEIRFKSKRLRRKEMKKRPNLMMPNRSKAKHMERVSTICKAWNCRLIEIFQAQQDQQIGLAPNQSQREEQLKREVWIITVGHQQQSPLGHLADQEMEKVRPQRVHQLGEQLSPPPMRGRAQPQQEEVQKQILNHLQQ